MQDIRVIELLRNLSMLPDCVTAKLEKIGNDAAFGCKIAVDVPRSSVVAMANCSIISNFSQPLLIGAVGAASISLSK